MRRIRRIAGIIQAAAFIFIVFSGCKKLLEKQPDLSPVSITEYDTHSDFFQRLAYGESDPARSNGESWPYGNRLMLLDAQMPIGASALFFIALALASVFLVISRSARKRLEMIIKQQTADIALQTSRLHSVEEEAQAASHAKTAFLANMSHELRSPLNVVIGLTDLILDEINLSENVLENLRKISNAGDTLLGIVNDILDFSKIESGKLTLMPAEYHITSLLNDVISLMIIRLGEKPVAFRLNIGDDLPCMLFGDDLRVKQIFNNLLGNALKYTYTGKIELTVNCLSGSADEKEIKKDVWMEIAVSDTGIGIRRENLEKLFSGYYQAESQANRRIEGASLGLPIAKKLTEMMDGEISVESEYGKGTTFRFRIRQGFADNTPIGPAVAEKLRSFHYAETRRNADKKFVRPDLSFARVLVVDDMQNNLDVAAGLLHKYNMQVDCVTTGQEAFDRIRFGQPVYNVVFMDHMMPGMDGLETADAIRSIETEYARTLPIIALTANAVKETENIFYAHDFQDFLSKPIDIMLLDTIVRKWVQRGFLMDNTAPPDHPAPGIPDKDEKTVIEIPGIDSEKGLSLLGGDLDIYLAALRSYAANIPAALDRLRNVSEKTLEDYVISVHGIKGTSANIGAERTREAALNLETLARDGDIAGVLSGNDVFISDTESMASGITAWLEQYEATI